MKKSRLIATILAGCAAATMLTGVAQAAAVTAQINSYSTYYLCLDDGITAPETQPPVTNTKNNATYVKADPKHPVPHRCNGKDVIKLQTKASPYTYQLNINGDLSKLKVSLLDSGKYYTHTPKVDGQTITLPE